MLLLDSLVTSPFLALLPALVLGLVAAWSGRRFVWFVAAAWIAYAAYETAMLRRILCTGECNIRIDLFLLHPALLLLTLIAVLVAWRTWAGRQRHER